ncbi:MAG TPA: beta-N-acetylhexosaminidase [Kofleriaceae bacterium]|nr:beta-N-acetylhexosaminidase [Kofleriaceae bacterium]
MSLAADVGQILWFGFHGTVAPPELLAQITAGEVGAVVVFKRNLVINVVHGPVPQEVVDLAALVALDQSLHAAVPTGSLPVLVCIDQEGGVVQRVRAPATQWPPMLSLDGHPAPMDAALAEDVGLAIGRELTAMGFDLDFAPVLDVHTNPANPIIGDRAFGRDPQTVTRRALAFARGLDRGGVIPCGKHFPGHGDTVTDSHLVLPRVEHDRARLEAVELAPFAAAAKAGVPVLMTAHVVYPALDPDRPATLSPAILTDLLRGQLGYRGVILSDDLDMRAIVDHGGVGDAAVAAVRAGCDALLLCRDPAHQVTAREALLAAAAGDASLRGRIAEAAERVRDLKASHGRRRAAEPAPGLDVVGAIEHRHLADRLAGTAA